MGHPPLDVQAVLAGLDTASPKDGWKILGPGGGGCVHCLTVSPHRPDTLLVACDMTAGYITHDGGQSWREFNLKSRLHAFAFDPVEPDVIYAGSSGLFRSEDNGQNWRLVFPDPAAVTGETRLGDEANHTFLSGDNWPGGIVGAIAIDAQQPERIHIAIRRDDLRLFLSQNHGRTWGELARLEGMEIHALFLDPHSPVTARELYAFTEHGAFRVPAGGTPRRVDLPGRILALRHASCGFNPATGRAVFYITAVSQRSAGRHDCGVWKSDDLGATWRRATSGLEPSVEVRSQADLASFSQVSACARDARGVYLIAEKFPELDDTGKRIDRYGILRSGDEGETWQWAVRMDDTTDPPNRTGGWAERDYGASWGDIQGEEQISPKGRFAWDIAASPVTPDVAYSMDFSTIFRTADGGRSWQQLCTHLHPDGSVSSRGIDVLSAYGVFFDPFDTRHIALALTDVGVFHSWNRGRTWLHALAGVPRAWINTCYWMVFDPEVKGRAWSVWAAMHDIPRSKMFREDYLQKYQGGICRTEDGMRTWQPSSRGLPAHSIPTHVVLDPASPAGRRTLYAAVFNRGVYKSTDDGRTWVPRNNGLDAANLFAWRLALLPDHTLYLVVVRGHMPAGEVDGAVYRSADGAEHWTRVALPEGVADPNDLAAEPGDPARLYLACWPRTVNGQERGGGLYASGDGGQSWSSLFDPSAHAYALAVDPDHPSRLFLGTFDAAVVRSDDRGHTWRRLRGCNFQWCQRPFLDPHHPGVLYLTTFGSSVWVGPADGVQAAAEDIVAE